ncbi:MAG: hypothetical protein IT384_06435 [Deltaproteobacteria bacterium]|nr:hypothetical protein [Deltaproteobacteria bacterium]
MSAVILPNGSLVFRLLDHIVHVDVTTQTIYMRDGHARRELEGSVLVSFPLSTAQLVRLLPESAEHAHLYVELAGGEVLDLGRVPVGEMSRQVAYALALLARCRVAAFVEPPRARGAAASRIDDETTSPSLPKVQGLSDPSVLAVPASDTLRETYRRPGSDSFRSPAPPPDQPTIIDDRSRDGPQPPIETVSAELVDDDDSPTHPPRDDFSESDEHEATVRIDFPVRGDGP